MVKKSRSKTKKKAVKKTSRKKVVRKKVKKATRKKVARKKPKKAVRKAPARKKTTRKKPKKTTRKKAARKKQRKATRKKAPARKKATRKKPKKAAKAKKKAPKAKRTVKRAPRSTPRHRVYNLTKEVPHHEYFVLANGQPVKHVAELASILDQIEDHVFNHHVNADRNDFHNWIKDIFSDVELARKITGVSDKKKLQLVIYRHLAGHE